MIKTFCDMCGEEMKQSANRTVMTLTDKDPIDSLRTVTVDVELAVAINGTHNGGHICLNCIKIVVNMGKIK